MGQSHSSSKNTTSSGNLTNSVDHQTGKLQDDPDYSQLGVVTVNISWLTATNRTPPEQPSEIQVTGQGALFHGNLTPSSEILSALSSVNLHPKSIGLLDTRSHHFLITYLNGWYALSSPEFFSRHSGTCIIIGDRTNPGKPYPLRIGDCFRLGSVGVVVSEIKTERGIEQRLDTGRLQYLREEALAFDGEDEAALAAEEEDLDKRKDEKTSHGENQGSGTFFCYMCYETHDTPEDHLVAPCDCKGDTRYLHVQCLQKWYQSSICGSKALVIRTTGNGAPACKICGAAYKTVFRNNGVKTNLLEMDHPGPYISLVVVTRHDTSPGLFNTKFRLNFGPGYRVGSIPNQLQDDPELTPTELTIGRSTLCNMVLDYRTVSTVHAKLTYRNGQFFVQDSRSSNGTMIYLQGPLQLPNNEVMKLRMGRSTLSIKAKRSIAASFRGALHRLPSTTVCTASLSRLQEIMALAPAPKSARLTEKMESERKSTSVVSNGIIPIAATSTTPVPPPPTTSHEESNGINNTQPPPNRGDDIDNPLILGPERKDGGSGRENLDTSNHLRLNNWNEPVPLTLPRGRGSSGNLVMSSSPSPSFNSPRENQIIQQDETRQIEILPSIGQNHHPHPHHPHNTSDDQSVSNQSGGGDSLSMVAVHHSENPLSAIASKSLSQQITPLGEEESCMDEQSDQAVASIRHLSRSVVNELMTNALK